MFQKAQRVRRHCKVALFGRWKTGKTRAALSFPHAAVIDTHRGTDMYNERYDFHVLHATTWKEIEAPISWLRKNAAAEKIESLVIDDLSTIYDDLIGEVSAWRANKSGSNAPLSQGDWGTIKRRWKAFLQMLLRLDLNVVLVIREKEEYEETTNAEGREVRKKTGNFLMDADKQTAYLFDFILYMYTEDNPKKKTSSHFVRVDGTRHAKLPKYSVHDVTGKRMYDALFRELADDLGQGEAPSGDGEPLVLPETEKEAANPPTQDPIATEPGAPDDPPTDTLSALNAFFGTAKIDEKDPAPTDEEIRTLKVRMTDMRWPDDEHKCRRQGCTANGHIHPTFKGPDGRSMIQATWGVESTKDLRKPQIEMLYEMSGRVLAGRAYLSRDREGTVFIASPGGNSEEEVRAKVLAY